MRLKKRVKKILVKALLLPIMPCLMWGPFTHPYIAKKVLEKAEKNQQGAKIKEITETIQKNNKFYIYAANSPDCIATNHILYNKIIYDYAHNYIPDRYDGSLVFGYRLLNTALERIKGAANTPEREKYERELAFACGWLTHQLSVHCPL